MLFNGKKDCMQNTGQGILKREQMTMELNIAGTCLHQSQKNFRRKTESHACFETVLSKSGEP